MKRLSFTTAGIALLFLIWITLSTLFGVSIVPYPWTVAIRLIDICRTQTIFVQTGITVLRSIIGFSLALSAGTVLGVLTGRIRVFEKTLFLPVSLLQGAPPILWIIPLMLILGTRGAAPVGVIFFVVLPLVIINIQEGTQSLDREMLSLFRVYAPSRRFMFTELYIPHLAPQLRSILLAGYLLAYKSSLVGEWFGARDGLGRMINEYFYTFNMPSFYAVAVVFLFALAIQAAALKVLTDRMFRRTPSAIDKGEHARSPLSVRRHESTLVMKDVAFSFGRKKVIDGLSFSLRAPATVILTGESGAGKTTFAKLATGILVPQRGSITVPHNACLIFQDDLLLPHLDCYANASLPARCRRMPDTASRTLFALDQCGLAGRAHSFPDELSGGMKKRLAFARALVFDPDFIILDEPFNNLHREARADLWELYFSLFTARGIPSVIITHFPEELDRFTGCDRLVLEHGSIVRRSPS